MKTHLLIAAMIYPVVNAVLFGLGVVPMLSIPALNEQAWTLLPIVVAGSFVVAVPISWLIAPRLRARYWREHDVKNDLLS